uniref:(California timema) hypothetical protein n=1 Tax=Timema californicum TaxID=61474 RepID=A0A7R9J7W5_TIMCA|nr:unnamed protein product [Timema californicum]
MDNVAVGSQPSVSETRQASHTGGRVGAESGKKMPVIMYFYPASPPCRAAMLVARAVGVDLNSNHTDITSAIESNRLSIHRLLAKIVSTSVDKGCRVVNTKNPPSVKLTPQRMRTDLKRSVLRFNWFSCAEHLRQSGRSRDELNFSGTAHADEAEFFRAIMGYFVNQYAKDDSLYPKDPKKRAMVDQKLYFDIGTLYQRFLNYFVSINLMPIAWKGMKPDAEALEKLEEAVGFLNSYLEGQGWVAGEDISIADYAIAVTMSNIEIVLPDLSKYKNVEIWSTKAKAAIPNFEEINRPGVNMFKKVYESKKN